MDSPTTDHSLAPGSTLRSPTTPQREAAEATPTHKKSLPLAISPLPDCDSFIHGLYGLEACFIRGIVRISNDSKTAVKVQSLKIEFMGTTSNIYPERLEMFDQVQRFRQLLSPLSINLLRQETLPAESTLDIPFELELPDPQCPSDLLRQAIRMSNLLPPSSQLAGRVVSALNSPFEARTSYKLLATLVKTVSTFYITYNKTSTTSVLCHPFAVYEPRLLPLLFQPDTRKWRSAPGETPIEHEIELSATTLGPGDSFRFSYRIAVSMEAASAGARTVGVSLALREHRMLGCEGGRLLKGSVDICLWDFPADDGYSTAPGLSLTPPPSPISPAGDVSSLAELGISRKMMQEAGLLPWSVTEDRSSTAEEGPRSSSVSPTLPPRNWNGLYVANDVKLFAPPRGGFVPTTLKPLDPDLVVQVPQHSKEPPAVVEIRHSFQVRIELFDPRREHHERFVTIVLESPCALASVNRQQCEAVLDETPELLPTIDYEKLFGSESWLPAYEAVDPLVSTMANRDHMAEESDGVSLDAVDLTASLLGLGDSGSDEGQDDPPARFPTTFTGLITSAGMARTDAHQTYADRLLAFELPSPTESVQLIDRMEMETAQDLEYRGQGSPTADCQGEGRKGCEFTAPDAGGHSSLTPPQSSCGFSSPLLSSPPRASRRKRMASAEPEEIERSEASANFGVDRVESHSRLAKSAEEM
ncbi:hypothetical protein DFJ73DRAFT_823331 [Zopfochytrium polystomum]|nr:hypothetical protein DFJ73DRAFT_823331 [Zopfochytrium polystomum]